MADSLARVAAWPTRGVDRALRVAGHSPDRAESARRRVDAGDLARRHRLARMLHQLGMHSALRVPMPLGADVFGSLFFLAREPHRYSESDYDFARRVADHLALALSHQRLAEAARRDAESGRSGGSREQELKKLHETLGDRDAELLVLRGKSSSADRELKTIKEAADRNAYLDKIFDRQSDDVKAKIEAAANKRLKELEAAKAKAKAAANELTIDL